MDIICVLCSNKGILGLTMGNRNRKIVKDLFKRLKNMDNNFWCTDAWKAFLEVFPVQRHLIGKRFTKVIEVSKYLINKCL
jgi:IS1 family transposase